MIDSHGNQMELQEKAASKNPKSYCQWWQEEIKSAVRYRTIYEIGRAHV